MGSRRNQCVGQTTSSCRSHLPNRLTPEAIFTEMSSAEMPQGHGLLSSHSCRAPESSGVCKPGVLSSTVKGLGSALLHKQKTHAPENVNYLLPASFDGRVLYGQIGINMERMVACVEVTLSFHPKEREREREAACGMESRSSGPA